jgi:hypothetical protein
MEETEQKRILDCVAKWLDIKNKYRGDVTTGPDVQHSALLRRLLEGKEPLPEPPPLMNSYPDYNAVEGTAPLHPWFPSKYDPLRCQLCYEGHRWERDKDIHPRCSVCGEHGHLACLRQKEVE